MVRFHAPTQTRKASHCSPDRGYERIEQFVSWVWKDEAGMKLNYETASITARLC